MTLGSARLQLCFRPDGLEYLDRIPGRVFRQRLVSAGASDDVASEPHAGSPKSINLRFEVIHFNREAIPTTRLGRSTVSELRAAAHVLSAGLGQYQAQVTAGKHGEDRRGTHLFCETEMLAIEINRRVDIINDVANLYCSHSEYSLLIGVI
jgi:hypothetical protein